MAVAIFVIVISLGAVAAGVGSFRAARRMHHFETTRGKVVKREVVIMPSTVNRINPRPSNSSRPFRPR